MNFSPTPSWIYELLQAELPPETLKQVESFIHSETWASPSGRERFWQEMLDLPVRFNLDIDVRF